MRVKQRTCTLALGVSLYEPTVFISETSLASEFLYIK